MGIFVTRCIASETARVERNGNNIQLKGASRGDDGPTWSQESNFIHHDFLQFGKEHSRHKDIL